MQSAPNIDRMPASAVEQLVLSCASWLYARPWIVCGPVASNHSAAVNGFLSPDAVFQSFVALGDALVAVGVRVDVPVPVGALVGTPEGIFVGKPPGSVGIAGGFPPCGVAASPLPEVAMSTPAMTAATTPVAAVAIHGLLPGGGDAGAYWSVSGCMRWRILTNPAPGLRDPHQLSRAPLDRPRPRSGPGVSGARCPRRGR
jgi:hypothetical protein